VISINKPQEEDFDLLDVMQLYTLENGPTVPKRR